MTKIRDYNPGHRDKDLLRVEGLESVKPSCWTNGRYTNRSPVSLFVTRKSNPITDANWQDSLANWRALLLDVARVGPQHLAACYSNAASAPGQSFFVARWIWIRTQRASLLSPADRLHSAAHKKSAQMNRRPPGSSGVQWLNRRDMSFRTEDSITLCQRALQIVTELCLTGHVDQEKCSDIFPLESNIPGKGYAGKWNKVIIFFSQFPHLITFVCSL